MNVPNNRKFNDLEVELLKTPTLGSVGAKNSDFITFNQFSPTAGYGLENGVGWLSKVGANNVRPVHYDGSVYWRLNHVDFAAVNSIKVGTHYRISPHGYNITQYSGYARQQGRDLGGALGAAVH